MEGRHVHELLDTTEGDVFLFDCVDTPIVLDELSARNGSVDVLWTASSEMDQDGNQFDVQFDFRWNSTTKWFSVHGNSIRRLAAVRPVPWNEMTE